MAILGAVRYKSGRKNLLKANTDDWQEALAAMREVGGVISAFVLAYDNVGFEKPEDEFEPQTA